MPRFGFSARWQDLRNRLLADSRFQRWAARFPLTRRVAHRKARELFDITAGFVYSQVLLACVQLRLFDTLADGPRSAASLAADADLPLAGMQRLLRAAETLRLVQQRDGELYGLGELGAAMLGNPGIGAMIQHHTQLYADLADPIALLKGRRDTCLSNYWPYATSEQPDQLTAGQVSEYSKLMAESQGFIADDVLDAYPLPGDQRLLDLAGGEGAFAAAAAARWPLLQVASFDLPAVADRANARFEKLGLGARARAIGGDLFATSLPPDQDLVSLVRVVHDHDDEQARKILEKARSFLRPGGTLLLAEPMADTRGAEPVGEAYFGFYLLAMGSGRPRTKQELCQMLQEAGFRDCQEVTTRRPLLVRMIAAKNGHE